MRILRDRATSPTLVTDSATKLGGLADRVRATD